MTKIYRINNYYKLLQGDNLLLECVYDTSTRTGTTVVSTLNYSCCDN